MCNQSKISNFKGHRSIFFISVAIKSLLKIELRDIGSLFMAVFEDLVKIFKNTSEKGPFLLVRFLWANNENEHDNTAKTIGLKKSDEHYFLFEKCLRRY